MNPVVGGINLRAGFLSQVSIWQVDNSGNSIFNMTQNDIGGAALIPLPWAELEFHRSASQLETGVLGPVFGSRMLILEQIFGNQ